MALCLQWSVESTKQHLDTTRSPVDVNSREQGVMQVRNALLTTRALCNSWGAENCLQRSIAVRTLDGHDSRACLRIGGFWQAGSFGGRRSWTFSFLDFLETQAGKVPHNLLDGEHENSQPATQLASGQHRRASLARTSADPATVRVVLL